MFRRFSRPMILGFCSPRTYPSWNNIYSHQVNHWNRPEITKNIQPTNRHYHQHIPQEKNQHETRIQYVKLIREKFSTLDLTSITLDVNLPFCVIDGKKCDKKECQPMIDIYRKTISILDEEFRQHSKDNVNQREIKKTLVKKLNHDFDSSGIYIYPVDFIDFNLS